MFSLRETLTDLNFRFEYFRLLNMLDKKSSHMRLSFDNFDDAVSKKFKLKQYLRETLSENYKNCLLVLLDVPDQMALKSFDLHCKTLMTTRNKEVSLFCCCFPSHNVTNVSSRTTATRYVAN